MPPEENKKRAGVRIADKQNAKDIEARRQEAIHFIGTMEGRVKDLIESCETLQHMGIGVQLTDFKRFQDLAAENLTFLIIIERRLKQIPQRNKRDLGTRFDELVVAVWSIVMKGSLSFMMTMSEEDYLPLGSKEVFVRELKTLNDAHSQLSHKRYSSRISKKIQAECEKAERIIMLIIEKAPRLLEF